MKELPQGWVTAQFGELIELKYGKALPDKVRDGHGFPVYGSNGIVGSHSEPLTNSETLIVGRKGSVGEVQYSAGPCSPIDTTYYVDCLWGMPFRYWFYYLRHLKLQNLNKATAVPGLSREDAYRLPIHLVPLNEQKRIADKLDAMLAQVDACRERLDRVPQILKRFRQAALAAATTGSLTEEWRGSQDSSAWEKVTLSKICLSIADGDHQAPPQVENGIPFITIAAMNEGKLNLQKATRYVSPSYYEKLKEHRRPKVGDILFSVTGSIAIPALVDIEDSFTFQRHIAILKPDLTHITSKYLLYSLGAESIKEQALSVATGTAQLTIPLNGLRSFLIDLPPKKEQHEIVCRVETLFAFADRLEARYIAGRERIDQLIPSLLDKAFNGELTAEWREQNPDLISGENSAEALLVRIKTEKTEADRVTLIHRKSAKTKTGKNMKSKMIIPVVVALKAAGTPLTAQALLTQSGYPSDATTEDLERFFLDIRDQLKLGAILRERSGDDDIFTLAN